MGRQNNTNRKHGISKQQQRQRKQVFDFLVRRTIKYIGGLAALTGFVFVLLASGSEDLSIILKLGIFGCVVMWLGVIIYNCVDSYEQLLKRNVRERKRMRAKMYIVNRKDVIDSNIIKIASCR